MTPLISIIIPAYNAEAWVAAAIESALAQTAVEKEIIVINDGSQDNTSGIARQFVAQDVRIVDQPNRGASAARNHGLRLASGEYIQYLDADDLLAPDKLARQAEVLRQQGPDVLASCSWGRFSSDPAQAEFTPQAVAAARTGIEFLQLHYETGSMMQPGAWLASRQLLDRAGPWDESLSLNDDGEYFARVMLTASRLVHVPDARCYYRSGQPGSLSRRTDRAALDSLFRSVELTIRHLRAADASARTVAAAADAWMRLAFEIYPAMPRLAQRAEDAALALGGSRRPLPGSGRFQLAARLLGWRLARRLFP